MREPKRWKMVIDVDENRPPEQSATVMMCGNMDCVDAVASLQMVAHSIGEKMKTAPKKILEDLEMSLIQTVQRGFEEGAYGEVEEE